MHSHVATEGDINVGDAVIVAGALFLVGWSAGLAIGRFGIGLWASRLLVYWHRWAVFAWRVGYSVVVIFFISIGPELASLPGLLDAGASLVLGSFLF